MEQEIKINTREIMEKLARL